MTDDFLHIARERGFIHQVTDEDQLSRKLSTEQSSAYVGFDLTADSLHVGHLLPLMLLRLFGKCGHSTVILYGDGTSMIGDPSGRDASRSMLTSDQIESNKEGIEKSINQIMGDRFASINNNVWLQNLNHIDFLRDIGANFSVNRMLTMDSVKNRLEREQPLSYLELGYMLLQSYDFLELKKIFNVNVQIGGSDQWGNIVMGVDLVRRKLNEQVFGITVPLLTTSSGSKMGKTANGAVWLNPQRLSVFDFWQFWRNTDDADVERFLGLFTDIAMDEVRRLGQLKDKDINIAKTILATEITAIVHGKTFAIDAENAAKNTFTNRQASENLPSFEFVLDETILDAMVRSKLVETKSSARRLIDQHGVRLNGSVISDPTMVIPEFGDRRLSIGKKKHVIFL